MNAPIPSPALEETADQKLQRMAALADAGDEGATAAADEGATAAADEGPATAAPNEVVNAPDKGGKTRKVKPTGAQDPVSKKAVSVKKGTVRFVSKDPGLFVLLGGAGRDVQFERGVAEVSAEVAELLEKNHLYIHDHISRADEVVRVNGKTVSFKGDPGFRAQIEKAAADGMTVFYIDAPRGTRIPMGNTTVTFSNGRALVDAETAERLRRHRFFIEGRLTELTI